MNVVMVAAAVVFWDELVEQ